VDRSWEYINRSQVPESGQWERGYAVSFLGIHYSDLLCIVLANQSQNCEIGGGGGGRVRKAQRQLKILSSLLELNMCPMVIPPSNVQYVQIKSYSVNSFSHRLTD
jgi:hypothetical protein